MKFSEIEIQETLIAINKKLNLLEERKNYKELKSYKKLKEYQNCLYKQLKKIEEGYLK